MLPKKGSIEEWLEDESFVNWVFKRNEVHFQQWEEWLTENPDQRIMANSAKEMLEDLVQEVEIPPRKSEEALTRLHQRLGKRSQIRDRMHANNQSRLTFIAISRVAAVLLILVGAFGLYTYTNYSTEIVIETGYGEKKDIYLPDSSHVTLNANSSLRYDKAVPREIWLEGEALFEVEKIPSTNAKFYVHTDDLVVEVLGTVFNVNSRRAQTTVFLEEGIVNLSLNDQENSTLELSPGDMVTFSSTQDQDYDRQIVQGDHPTSWQDGIVELSMTPLGEALVLMEDLYGIKIQVQNPSLIERKINVALPVQDPSVALEQLRYALGLDIIKLNEFAYIINK